MNLRRTACAYSLAALSLLTWHGTACALGQAKYVEFVSHPDDFAIAEAASLADIYVDANDHAGVVRAVGDLAADIDRVTGRTAAITKNAGSGTNLIIVGTIGKSAVIDQLIREKKLDVSSVAGKWESFLIQVVPRPLPGVDNGLIIAGSDKRGTIYGVYDLSEQIGVSPWYWWADVPVQHKDALFVRPGRYVQESPAVKYRGIFLNDEAPALSGWVQEKFGNFNHQFYGRFLNFYFGSRPTISGLPCGTMPSTKTIH
jgi:Glycosyl hydrolase family 115/Glycosyl hydrolase family 67 N-terminus